MACCAFAVMLLTQLLMPIRAVGAWLGFGGERRPDAAVLWVPGMTRVAVRGGVNWTRVTIGLLAFDLVALAFFRVTGVAEAMPRFATPGTQTAHLEEIIHASICGHPERKR